MLKIKDLLIRDFYRYVPLLSVILLEAHIRFLINDTQERAEYLLVSFQLVFECLPLLVGHCIAGNQSKNKAILTWLTCFIFYPLSLIVLNGQNAAFELWSYFNLEVWFITMAASLLWFIQHTMKQGQVNKFITFFSGLFSLNNVVLILVVGWALFVAGIFNSHVAPMLNQPINPVIELSKLISDFGPFLFYLWQFLVISSLIYITFLLNRYVLIRKVLAEQGIIIFCAAVLLCLIVLTPTYSYLILALPVNQVPEYITTLIPSGNQNIFSPYNYQFMFVVFAVSTPIILAFERQKQDAKMHEISKQQIQTELKLLQQQINPHFLFNTLNNLYALTLIKSDEAPDMVMQLSNLLRYSVYEGQKAHVNLSQEVSYLQDYIALQTIRNKDKCNISVNWPENANQHQIAPLLLVILLENAFKHGVDKSVDQCELIFNMTLKNNTLIAECINDFEQAQTSKPKGIGLENLKRRLSLIYHNKHNLETHQTSGKWHVILTLELD
ncbi:histidine kinase [Pseudoalteromonas sp. C2R02]|uniref:sensor histidine kinase n=1 Tax=Pseudoalteromonas sp. C2R02 TaxID=2841565 RepID=UPI001C098863|nr:histidine kinase [Pseudoalteromonas sp. C2R02]